MMWACRECGTNISAEAEVCPRCGIRFAINVLDAQAVSR
jgi:RNA polymerase subunit RPABC4/transcription elongation factor Spt4